MLEYLFIIPITYGIYKLFKDTEDGETDVPHRRYPIKKEKLD